MSKEQNKANYKKRKQRGVYIPLYKETVSLYDSSIQENDRESSTLAHFTNKSYQKIGEFIEQIYKKHYNQKSLAYAKFLDIGSGHGACLAYMHQVFRVWAVGVEVCPRTYEGSMNLLREIKKVRTLVCVNINYCFIIYIIAL